MNIEEEEIIYQLKESVQGMFELDIQYEAWNRMGSNGCDGILQLNGASFACVMVQKVSTYTLSNMIARCMEVKGALGLPVLLISGEINLGKRQRLHEMGIHTMDAAGNCYIQTESLMMYCEGKKNVVSKTKETLSFKEPGLKVIYHILNTPQIVNEPLRDIQAQTGVGLATIFKLFTALKNNGYLFTSASGRHLRRHDGLLSIFIDSYCRVMKPKLRLTTMKFLPGVRERWRDIVLPQGMQWGGEPGAFLLDGYLLPEVWDVYSSVASQELIRARIAVPAPDGEIRIYRKFWEEDDEKTAPPLIIYADLMGSGDSRCIEAANRFLTHELPYLC